MRTDHAAWAAPGEAELRVNLPLGGEAEAEGEGEGEGEGSVQLRCHGPHQLAVKSTKSACEAEAATSWSNSSLVATILISGKG